MLCDVAMLLLFGRRGVHIKLERSKTSCRVEQKYGTLFHMILEKTLL